MRADLTPFADRLVAARPDLAAEALRGRVAAPRYATGRPHRVARSLLDLTLEPDRNAVRATQLIHGEIFTAYEMRPDGLAWGQAERDGYVGYVQSDGLGPVHGRGRQVTALWSQVYARPAVRSQVTEELPFLAEIPVSGTTGAFARLRTGGHVPLAHIAPLAGDFVAQAERFVGVPYLWGGRSALGIDCSGLVQVALLAAGRPAPRDSDMQAAMVGTALERNTPLRRGDLIFWKGHVGIVRDPETLLHATAHHMAVVLEPLRPTIERIAATGGGPVLTVRRA